MLIIYSVLVGLNASSLWPVLVVVQEPSGLYISGECFTFPRRDSNNPSPLRWNRYCLHFRSMRIIESPKLNLRTLGYFDNEWNDFCYRILNIIDFVKYIPRVQIGCIVIKPWESHNSGGVYYYYCSFRSAAFVVKNPICFRDWSMWIKVWEYWIWDWPKRPSKRHLRWSRIAADTQNLGILILETGIVNSERGYLVSSATCKRVYVKW